MDLVKSLENLWLLSGFVAINGKQVIMIFIACFLIYLAIKKGFEPLLLLPIAFGMLVANLPLGGLQKLPIYEFIDGQLITKEIGGLFYYLSSINIFRCRGYDSQGFSSGWPRRRPEKFPTYACYGT